MRGQRHAPAAPYPRQRPGTHCTGGWVGLRAGLDWCGKSRPPPGFDHRTVQPTCSRYIYYASRPTCCSVTQCNRIVREDLVTEFYTVEECHKIIINIPLLVLSVCQPILSDKWQELRLVTGWVRRKFAGSIFCQPA